MTLPDLRQALLVGSGGFVGSVLRWVVGGWVHRMMPAATLPWGTVTVNVAGCFVIGLLGGLAEFRSLIGPNARLFVMIGLLGGFTTFSTFGYEGLGLLRDQQHAGAALYVLVHLVLGFGAAWLGFSLARWM